MGGTLEVGLISSADSEVVGRGAIKEVPYCNLCACLECQHINIALDQFGIGIREPIKRHGRRECETNKMLTSAQDFDPLPTKLGMRPLPLQTT